MSFFGASPFLKALGWALLNSFWQFGLLLLLYWVVAGVGKKLTASAKHNICIYFLFAGTIWFIAGLTWKYYSYPSGSEFLSTSFRMESFHYYNGYTWAQRYIDKFIPYWSSLYLVCIAYLFVKLCLFLMHAKALQTNGITKMPADWRMYVNNAAIRLGIEKQIKAVFSTQIDTPQVIGFLKPVILVPLACLTNLTTDQMEAVLLHELVHIKRNDYFTNIFVATAEILFFFNPFVKQLVVAIRQQREYSCDDMVIQFQYEPHHYAAALLTLERNRKIASSFGISALGSVRGQLLTRIQRILGIKCHPRILHSNAHLVTVLIVGFIALVSPVKMAVDRLEKDSSFSVYEKPSSFASGKEAAVIMQTGSPSEPRAKRRNEWPVQHSHAPALAHEATSSYEDAGLQTVSALTETDKDSDADENIQTTLKVETRDFSIPESSASLPQEAAEAPSAVAPYVPSNSFSYQFIPDTSHKKTKGETYPERLAREAMIRTQKALEEINWNKIERELKYNKKQLSRLKLEMTKELAKLNWQKINKDVQDALQEEKLEQVQEVFDKQHTIKQYQQTQALYEALERQLEEKDQLIKDSDQHLKDTQETLKDQEKRIHEVVKKKRIISI